jgi:5-methylcytosine-specific restriction protein A
MIPPFFVLLLFFAGCGGLAALMYWSDREIGAGAARRHAQPPETDANYARWGVARSGQWETVRHAHLKREPRCAACEGTKNLNVHHVKPVHLFPELELHDANLVTLCEGTMNCHLAHGHLGDFHAWNPAAIADAAVWQKKAVRRKYSR